MINFIKFWLNLIKLILKPLIKCFILTDRHTIELIIFSKLNFETHFDEFIKSIKEK